MKRRHDPCDLRGMTFGSRYVYGEAPPRKDGARAFYVRCKCGKTGSVTGRALKTGAANACISCTRKARDQKLAQEDVGKRWGSRTVIGVGETTPAHGTILITECDCGWIGPVARTNFLRGKSLSCISCSNSRIDTSSHLPWAQKRKAASCPK